LILLVDIGNSRAKYLPKSEFELDQSALMVNNCDISFDWLTKNWFKATKIILASVAGEELNGIIALWAKGHGIALLMVESEPHRFGVTSFYQKPSQLGVDRWLALLGANKLFSNKNLLVVDAGTATTIDCLKASGQHKGGWILPGIDIMFSSLLDKTANIDAKINQQASLSFGANTTDNVNSACWAATVGLIECAIKQSSEHFSLPDHIVLTGGNARQLQPLLSQPIVFAPNLIFHGLARF
jgi:type III pantothenate kinase